jgi:hypothetical protein
MVERRTNSAPQKSTGRTRMANNTSNGVMHELRRLNNRSDETGDKMADFIRRQMNGEQPDPSEFTAILEKRSTTHDAMRAQFKLLEKPLKTVLQDVK